MFVVSNILVKISDKTVIKHVEFPWHPNVVGWMYHVVPECVLCLVFGDCPEYLSL